MIGTEAPLDGRGTEGALSPLKFGNSENRTRDRSITTVQSIIPLDSKYYVTGPLKYRNVTDDHEVDRLMSLLSQKIAMKNRSVLSSCYCYFVTTSLKQIQEPVDSAPCLDHAYDLDWCESCMLNQGCVIESEIFRYKNSKKTVGSLFCTC